MLSHLGVARELSAIFQIPLKVSALDDAASDGETGKVTSVTMDAPALCPRYGAKVIEGVQVGPSPRWLKERLEKIGIRSINNVVDVTNYILMDIGHPMHAFDFDTLEGRRIVVRSARAGEKFRTLDNVERTLDPSMLVIADADRPVALAGVMGGLETEVTEKTRTLLLEAAYFDPVCIRRTAKALGMMSESSYRFERGTNIENIPIALNLATKHILAVAGGKARSGIVDGYPEPRPQRTILVRRRRVEQILGISLTTAQIEALLNRLLMDVKRNGEDVLVAVPPFRHDLEQEADIIEEIARIHGYQHIPTTLPAISGVVMPPDPVTDLGDKIRDYLIGQGFCQALNYSFVPAKVPELFHEGLPIRLVNPLSEDQAVLRTSLVWGMFDAIVRNVNQDEYDIKMFEIGRVFHRDGGEGTDERVRLCLGICGRWNPGDWRHINEMVDTFHLKGVLEALGRKLGRGFEFKASQREYYHPTDQMEIRCQNQLMGHGGRVHPKLLDNPKIPRQMYLVEIDLTALARIPASMHTMKPIPGFPAIRRDLALVLPPEVTAGQVKTVIKEECGTLLE
ncbi:MAG TPA: phenylalanine--tRNA ligase subunit beta, partial [Candidatus Ozemobacteraceae bacterium]|nr:phenylalanine--tRNA ligase subunit beta [Candidatus Ozemobacteraceae bacterium]